MRLRLLSLAAMLPLGACFVPLEGPAAGDYASPAWRDDNGVAEQAFNGPTVTFGTPPRSPYYGRSYNNPYGSPYRQRGWGQPSYGGYGGSREFSPSRRVVCDRATQVCYKRGNIDKSETQDAFGDRAGDRADDIRDRYGRDDLYVPRRGVACDDAQQVCYKNGRPDRSETRDVFGKKASKRF